MWDDAKISVIMGIYNCAKTLGAALDCIVNQTYANWEIIMCDDGSSDDTYYIASEYQTKYPQQITLLKNETNLGLNTTLNKCLAEAKGKFIARMDGDDLCSPERFELEMLELSKHPDMAIVSTDMEFFDETGTWGQTNKKQFPVEKDFMTKTPFCHAPCLVKKEAYDTVGGYTVDKKLLRVEDYHLWVKMYAAGYKGMNIQRPLYQMRDDRNSKRRRKFKYRFNESYVKAFAIRQLHLPLYCYLYCVRPILIGFLPSRLYELIHKRSKMRGRKA